MMTMMKMIIYIKDARDTATTTTISMIPTTKIDLRFQHSHLNDRSHSSEDKIHSNFMEKNIFKYMGQRWEQRSLLLSQISSWQK